MLTTRNEQVAWAAGLFEGEGCISIRVNGSGRRYPEVTLDSTDKDVVERFHHIVGLGRLTGPYHREGVKPHWRVKLGGLDSRAALAVFAPFLGERRTARMHEVLAQSDVPINRKENT